VPAAERGMKIASAGRVEIRTVPAGRRYNGRVFVWLSPATYLAIALRGKKFLLAQPKLLSTSRSASFLYLRLSTACPAVNTRLKKP